ncbi:hypothetical protein VKT23_008646 [Stygiomarasmius scandens]|uniref:Uncharacterized protein n=1 Tax=Marasmiellus scandens TaxID=2682957 RepID=A0ABR1JN57_9AGAR
MSNGNQPPQNPESNSEEISPAEVDEATVLYVQYLRQSLNAYFDRLTGRPQDSQGSSADTAALIANA